MKMEKQRIEKSRKRPIVASMLGSWKKTRHNMKVCETTVTKVKVS